MAQSKAYGNQPNISGYQVPVKLPLRKRALLGWTSTLTNTVRSGVGQKQTAMGMKDLPTVWMLLDVCPSTWTRSAQKELMGSCPSLVL